MRKLIIHPDMPEIARERGLADINGPSAIRVPEWVERPLGRYYLYFAHHGGRYIRMAHADEVGGPWTVYAPGVLQIDRTPFTGHIASPDVHLDEERRTIRMYYHGAGVGRFKTAPKWEQPTCFAESRDGLEFTSGSTPIGPAYARFFRFGGQWYAVTGGNFGRSPDGRGPLEESPTSHRAQLCAPHPYRPGRHAYRPRHLAARIVRDRLEVFFSRVGDAPEHILKSVCRLTADWKDWTFSAPTSVLKPEYPWEGSDAPHVPSVGGAAQEPVWQLRDPYVFEDAGHAFLFYAVAGESGIAVTELPVAAERGV